MHFALNISLEEQHTLKEQHTHGKTSCSSFRSNAGGRRSKFLVRETRTRNLAQETCIQVAHRTIQVSRTRNMADDRDDKEFQILFFSG